MRELGRRIAAGQAAAGRGRARALEDRGMELLSRDPALKAALFRCDSIVPVSADACDVLALSDDGSGLGWSATTSPARLQPSTVATGPASTPSMVRAQVPR